MHSFQNQKMEQYSKNFWLPKAYAAQNENEQMQKHFFQQKLLNSVTKSLVSKIKF